MRLQTGVQVEEYPTFVKKVLDHEANEGPGANGEREDNAAVPLREYKALRRQIRYDRDNRKRCVSQDERAPRHPTTPAAIKAKIITKQIRLVRSLTA